MNKHLPAPPKQIAPVPNPAQQGGISGAALQMELVREICQERAADPDGLEPAEAEALSNALLRAFGQDKEYPCLLEDPAPRHNMIPIGGPGQPDLVATENSAQAEVCRDPLPLLLRAMRMTADSGGEAEGSLTPGPSPARQTTPLGRGENGGGTHAWGL